MDGYSTPATTNGVHINGSSNAGPSKIPTSGATVISPPMGFGSTATSNSSSSTQSTSNNPQQQNYSPLQTTTAAHDQSIINHLYTTGFQHGNYADLSLHVFNRQYRLHAIILSRSPYLAHLINTRTAHPIFVPLEQEPLITEEGFFIAVGYLYSSISLKLLNASNALSVLASACLLGGMDDLAHAAYQCCRTESISLQNISGWIEFLNNITLFSQPQNHSTNGGSHSSIASPTASPLIGSVNGSLSAGSTFGYSAPPTPAPVQSFSTVLGPYAQRLKEDVFTFLVVTLPTTLQAFSPNPQTRPTYTPQHTTLPGASTNGDSEGTKTGAETLLQVYSLLPFDIFKQAVESPSFPIGGDQARFRFVKDAIAARKKQPAGREAEESVVLAFGRAEGSASAVHVTRKLRKKPLWKVSK